MTKTLRTRRKLKTEALTDLTPNLVNETHGEPTARTQFYTIYLGRTLQIVTCVRRTKLIILKYLMLLLSISAY